ncbi:DUF1460 domain-containing protein [Parabacteroides sp. OttesenSCG-928-G06]|nr:DUF1460 domain-containing protein [Parabacteroides sp. OttesenSCG-928-G06]
MIRYFLCATILYLTTCCVNGQTSGREHLYDTPEDKDIFARYIAAMETKRELPVADLFVETGLFFLETPYVAATLEKEPEGLVVNLREMDCTTFVENVYALVRTLKMQGTPSYEAFCDHLQQLRYREGTITDYTDRLHYTTDWIFENERKGLLRDVTKEIGGEPLPLALSFMSTHPDSYRQLKGNPERIKIMAEKEEEISRRSYYYIAENNIADLTTGMQQGDMVGFVTTIGGLDLSHVGIIYRTGERVTFLHASSSAKKVIVQDEELAAYVKRIKTNKGVMIIRFQM